jgi:hypothetical protein
MDSIKDILDKISSYNIFNYLLPGILFVFLTKEITGYNLIQENNLIGAFLYYFIGMVVSRFGSLFIEPFLKKVRFLKFSDYKSFVIASQKDNKIELLSEVNNTYRTILSMFLLLIFEKIYLLVKTYYGLQHETTLIILTLFITMLFLFSYRKQTNYITKRIEANNHP